MKGRFQISETTSYLHNAEGLRQVTIVDTVMNLQAVAVARTYEEAVSQAWQKLKEIQPSHPRADRTGLGEHL